MQTSHLHHTLLHTIATAKGCLTMYNAPMSRVDMRVDTRVDMMVKLLSRLFCSATHFNTLQHTSTHCNTLQHTATRCNTLQHTATHRAYCVPSPGSLQDSLLPRLIVTEKGSCRVCATHPCVESRHAKTLAHVVVAALQSLFPRPINPPLLSLFQMWKENAPPPPPTPARTLRPFTLRPLSFVVSHIGGLRVCL